MHSRKSFWAIVIVTCIGLAGPARSETPLMERDPIAYLHQLETSTDATDVAIRTEIQNGPENLARAKAALIKAGVPVNASKLQKPLPPEDQNAAPVYQKLAELLKQKPLDLPTYAQPLTSANAYTPEQIADIQKIYDSRQDVWYLVHEAADKPQCVAKRDWGKGPGMEFADFATLRQAARLIVTETYLLAAQGKFTEAVKNQTRGFRIASHAASDPVLISLLVGYACDSISLSGMQTILQLAGPNAPIAAKVKSAIADNRPKLSQRSALDGEIAIFETGTFQQIRTGVETNGIGSLLTSVSALSGEPPSKAVLGPTTEADKAFVLAWIDASEARVYNQILPFYVAADEPKTAKLTTVTKNSTPADSPEATTVMTMFSSMVIPTLDRLPLMRTSQDARVAVTEAAAGVLAAWAKEGGFPSTLPETVTDPFNGKALGYHREGGDGFVVYSVGPKGDFTGGKPGGKTPSGEVVFRYSALSQSTKGH